MTNPIVSILMPVYNAGKYLKIAIDGILAQTFSDFELIIVNDGSIDNSEEIILSYTDSRIKYFKQENAGVAQTLNNGLKFCTGKYIRRHDADDLSTPNAIEKQIEFLNRNPQFPLVGTRITFMTSNGKIAKKYTNPTKKVFNEKYFIEVTKENYWETRPIIHATILAKKCLFEEVGVYRTEFTTAEDIDLWYRILEKHPLAVINECNYFVRLHGTSNTHVHGNKNDFYRNLSYDFYKERQKTGTDALMRGEPMPKPPEIDYSQKQKIDFKLAKQHKLFREDILNYQYLIFVDAKDWKLVLKSIRMSIQDGWKLKQTWKSIIFPILGKKIVNFGVKVKSIFK
jgi:glycosyltransferase involved in cell wall biosynthesis